MKAIDCPFTKIINGTSQFVIPVFQRDYNWTEAECEQLWNDIVSIADAKESRPHFLGSVVYVSTEDSNAGFTRWLLIDGQQRVTTLTLLLAALRDHIEASKWSGGPEGPTGSRIDAYYLRNVHEEGARRHKLVLRRHDQATLQAILDREALPQDASTRIRDNYDYFREQLRAEDPGDVYRGIGRLVVVDVSLHPRTDDPQLIFESLNSTGMDLSQSDLIRNFILMRLPEKVQTRLYETHWNKIEGLFRGSERTFDAFVRDFIALRTQASKQEKTDEIYFAFRRVFASLGGDSEALDPFLAGLLQRARQHAAFSVGVGAPEALRESLARLRRHVDVPAIVLMRLFECHDEHKTLTELDLAEAIALIESYIFRRAVCGEQTRGYWQVFADLAYQIETAKPLESLKVGFGRLRGTYRFPSDEEFEKALLDRDLYGMRICFDFLERLENHGSKERTDTSKYTIEHIMPQNEKLIPAWSEMLGPDWSQVQRRWLHKLGNLTLTGYNSEYQDKAFDEKKKTKGGFEESAVRLNKYVREQKEWTAAQMDDRARELARRALTVWSKLVVDPALVDAAEQAEMRACARRRDAKEVPMSQSAGSLFDALRAQVLKLDGGIIEFAHQKSVSYMGPQFFMEVLPRKNRIVLLLGLQYGEVEDPAGISQDATQWKFLVNAMHSGGVLISVEGPNDLENAMPMVRRAWELARS